AGTSGRGRRGCSRGRRGLRFGGWGRGAVGGDRGRQCQLGGVLAVGGRGGFLLLARQPLGLLALGRGQLGIGHRHLAPGQHGVEVVLRAAPWFLAAVFAGFTGWAPRRGRQLVHRRGGGLRVRVGGGAEEAVPV